MRRAKAVHSHLFQELQTVFLYPFRYSFPCQAIILMATDSLDENMPTVQEKAFVGVKTDMSVAKPVFYLIQDFSIPVYAGDDDVLAGIGYIP